MSQDMEKRLAAEAALAYLEDDSVIGVGTGSTVNYFIDALADVRVRIEAAVSSSEASSKRLKAVGIPVMDLNAAGPLNLYVDGADEANARLQLVKGGGGALTREKIVAAASETFVCIADASKYVDVLGHFPIPVEVIPMARSYVARELLKRGGQPVWREDFTTDNGNLILDVHNLAVQDAEGIERDWNDIAGVVAVGIFALRPADILLLGDGSTVRTIKR